VLTGGGQLAGHPVRDREGVPRGQCHPVLFAGQFRAVGQQAGTRLDRGGQVGRARELPHRPDSRAQQAPDQAGAERIIGGRGRPYGIDVGGELAALGAAFQCLRFGEQAWLKEVQGLCHRLLPAAFFLVSLAQRPGEQPVHDELIAAHRPGEQRPGTAPLRRFVDGVGEGGQAGQQVTTDAGGGEHGQHPEQPGGQAVSGATPGLVGLRGPYRVQEGSRHPLRVQAADAAQHMAGGHGAQPLQVSLP
jgi:hypothetical protein